MKKRRLGLRYPDPTSCRARFQSSSYCPPRNACRGQLRLQSRLACFDRRNWCLRQFHLCSVLGPPSRRDRPDPLLSRSDRPPMHHRRSSFAGQKRCWRKLDYDSGTRSRHGRPKRMAHQRLLPETLGRRLATPRQSRAQVTRVCKSKGSKFVQGLQNQVSYYDGTKPQTTAGNNCVDSSGYKQSGCVHDRESGQHTRSIQRRR